jgi:LPXTG-motif cell wall-anchored protein
MKFAALLSLCVALALTVACGDSDESLTNSVKAGLAADGAIKADNISVDTRDRVVTLTGTAESEREQQKALQIARATDGVTEVVNNITVVPSADTQSVATTGTTDEAAQRSDLPATASPLPLIAVVGALSLVGGLLVKRFRKR